MNKIYSFILIFTFLTACAVGPNYERPETAAGSAVAFINTDYASVSKNAMNRWWENINDPLLHHYINVLITENLSLRQAEERIIQAREQLNIERGGFLPTISGTTDASRSFTPSQQLNNGFGGAGGSERLFATNYNATLNTAWEIDLFGKIRRANESARAGYQASLYDREALIHSLIADLLNRRVAVSVNRNLLNLAQSNAENREKIAGLVRNRYNAGVRGTSLADVYLAEENFTTVQADVYQYERLLSEDVYQLDILLGQPPGTVNPTQSIFPHITPPLDAPICLPANLLDRRPDLKASELRVQAANADIGVAIADLYPALNLGGNIGFSGNELNNLFRADQLAGSILSSITARLFEGGKLRANVRLQESEARELSAAYAENVLNAMREVETALKAEQELTKELLNLNRSVESLRSAEEISEERYVRGILTLKEFLDLQQRRYNAEQQLLMKQQQKWNTRVSLYKALGGDWFGTGVKDQCVREAKL